MVPKPPGCAGCPLEKIGVGFVPFQLRKGPILMVGEQPGEDEAASGQCFTGGSGQWLRSLCRNAGIDFDQVSLTNTVLCNTRQDGANIYPLSPDWHLTSRQDAELAIKHCTETYLWPNITRSGKERVFAIGAQALKQLTGRDGIHTWRGSPLPLLGRMDRPRVIPTIHPAALMRQAKLSSVVVKDLRKSCILPPENYNLFPTLEELEAFKSRRFAFDLEWDGGGNVTLCGLSDRFYTALVVPFHEPYLGILRRIFENATDIIGHNIIQADLPFIENLGWDVSRAVIHDTMLKQHLVQPDYPHSLAFVASVLTNKVFWKGKWEAEEELGGEVSAQQWRSWDRPWGLPRELGGYMGCHSAVEAFNLYNARDTDAEFQIDTPLSQLVTRYQLQDVYNYVSVPSAYICRSLGSQGLKLDTRRLGEVRSKLDSDILSLEAQLPEGLKPYDETVSCNIPAPPGTLRPRSKVCKGTGKLRHEPYTKEFLQVGEALCEVCGRVMRSGKLQEAKILKGTRQERVVPYNSPQKVQAYVASLELKEVYDTKTKRVTTGKKARKVWAKHHPEFTLLGGLKQKKTLKDNFAKDALLEQERMFFRLLVHGTGEGRLSSKGLRQGIDLNIQNQPKEFRKIYIPDHPDWGFLSLDVVQGENMLTCWLAKDWPRWERLQQPDYNEHSDLASRIFNRKVIKGVQEDEPFYLVGKIFNHSKNYGAGARKQQEILAEHGYDHYTTEDLREFNAIWETMNAGTALWQKQTIETMNKQGYLRNPFGRMRWFSSRDSAAKALAFIPASSLADMVLRMMIAHYPGTPRIGEAIPKLGLETYLPIIQDWIMSIQVHDELVFQGPWDGVQEQASRSKMIMTQPWRELDGFRFGVDVKASQKSWGECKHLEVA